MTVQEFSNEFDILYNNIMSNQAPGLNEYEKSVFLTKAQDEIIKNYFNPKGNKYQEGFDQSAKRQIDFSTLIRTINVPEIQEGIKISTFSNSKLYLVPEDILLYINEFVDVNRRESTNRLIVTALNYNDYALMMSKLYKRPLKNQAWRIIVNGEGSNYTSTIVEIIPGVLDSITNYTVRYIKRPKPIILEDLVDVSINGRDTISNCELDPIIHQEILQRAVELAKAAYIGDINTTLEVGKRSE